MLLEQREDAQCLKIGYNGQFTDKDEHSSSNDELLMAV